MKKLFILGSLFLVVITNSFALPAYVKIKDVPHIKQKPDFCGEACVEMVLRSLGHKSITQDDVFDASGLDPALGRGCYTAELRKALLKLNFRIGKRHKDVWRKVAIKSAGEELDLQFKKLHKDLAKGIMSIVCMHSHDGPGATEHFRLIVGYDPEEDAVIYHEPAEKDGAYKQMARKLFLKLWPLKYDRKEWTVIRFRLKPGEFQLAANKNEVFSDADYAQHIMAIKRRFQVAGCKYIVEKPFVVVGNESHYHLKKRAQSTVRWIVKHLKRSYFKKDPDRILTVWLLKDSVSFHKVAQKVTGYPAGTPFGFYSSRCDALIMNISTGGGTLCHEIVHPFVEANFPGCPPWLNEGLGSLYEQCGERGGRLVGFTNWRLAGLKEFIHKGDLPSFKKLCSYNDFKFYRRDPGCHYSQARYLCYYLQQKRLLRKFYRTFYKNRKEDPSGYYSLMKVLKTSNMKQFQKEWQNYVLKLKFP